MNKVERDPAQCRILRQADRRFLEDIKRFGDKRQRMHDRSVEIRRELSGMRTDLRRLQAMEAAAGALGAAGKVISAGAVDLSLGVRVSVLQGRIDEREMALAAAKADVANLRYQIETAQREHGKNAERLDALNCVRDS
ncbi:MAG: hypothetical protein AB3N20_02695 [Rhizobiaceae bacterium]